MRSDGHSVGRHLLNSHVVQAGDCNAGPRRNGDADITVCNVGVVHKQSGASRFIGHGKVDTVLRKILDKAVFYVHSICGEDSNGV